jgi:hypothetical protein
MKSRRALLVPLILVLGTATARSGSAQESQVDILHTADYVYGVEVTFTAQIEAPARVTRASVVFQPEGSPDARVLDATLLPGLPIRAKATHDLRASPIRPFASVTYWWRVELENGTQATSESATFTYADNRFEWRSVQGSGVTLHWTQGELDFAQAALDVALESLGRIRRDLALPASQPLDIYLYPTPADLSEGLQLGGRSWAGGHADPDLGVVLLAVPAGPEGRIQLQRGLPHELTHILLFQRMGQAYGNLPAWLNEGLATLEERAPDPDHRLALNAAIDERRRLPLQSLCTTFPTSGTDALLAYAKSASVVQYLKDIYGSGAVVALLDAYQEGTTCAGGVQRVLRRSIHQLDTEWRSMMVSRRGALASLSPLLPWLVLTLPVLLLIALASLPLRRRREGRDTPPES